MVRLSPSRLDVGVLKSVDNTPPAGSDARLFYNEPENLEQALAQSTAKLWLKLKDALDNSARERVASQRAQAQALVGLDQAFTPHGQEARLKARGFLAANAKVLVRMQAAANALEIQASAAQAAHTAEEAQWHRRTQQLVASTKAVGDATARALLQEVKRCELEAAATKEALLRRMADESHQTEVAHQREARSMRQQFELERDALNDELAAVRAALESARAQAQSERQQARYAQDELSEELHRSHDKGDRLEADLARDRAALQGERSISLQHAQENATLRADLARLSAELEGTRLDLRGQVERLSREKRAMVLEYEGQLQHAHKLRDDEVASLQASMAKMRDGHTRAHLSLQSQLEAVQTDRQADALAYESKINRLQALQKAALAAGSARGRQMLYTESVRSPELWRASSLTWRGEDWEPSSACASPHASLSSSSAVSPRPLARSHSGASLSPPSPSWSSPSASSRARAGARLAKARSPPSTTRPRSAASPRGGGRTDIGGGSRWAHEATAEAIAAAAAEAEEMEAFELAEESRVREDEIEGAPLSVSLTAERDKALFTSVFTPP
jgi:hypothetical protein